MPIYENNPQNDEIIIEDCDVNETDEKAEHTLVGDLLSDTEKGLGILDSAAKEFGKSVPTPLSRVIKVASEIANDVKEEDKAIRVICNAYGTVMKFAVSAPVSNFVGSKVADSMPQKKVTRIIGRIAGALLADEAIDPITEQIRIKHTQSCKVLLRKIEAGMDTPAYQEWQNSLSEPDLMELSHQDAALLSKKILTGFGNGLATVAAAVESPMEKVVEPLAVLLWDAGVLGTFDKNSSFYAEAHSRMSTRWNGLKQGAEEFRTASFPDQVEAFTQIITESMVGARVLSAAAQTAKHSANILRFGSTVSPSSFFANELFNSCLGKGKNLTFGVGEKGDLLISQGFSVNVGGKSLHFSMMDPAKKIVAAGEFSTTKTGVIKQIDLISGNGNLTATRAMKFVEDVFRRQGFGNTRGKAKIFTESRSFNQYQPPKPPANNNLPQTFKKRKATNTVRFPEQLPSSRLDPTRANNSIRNARNVNEPTPLVPLQPVNLPIPVATGIAATVGGVNNVVNSIRTGPIQRNSEEFDRTDTMNAAARMVNEHHAANTGEAPPLNAYLLSQNPNEQVYNNYNLSQTEQAFRDIANGRERNNSSSPQPQTNASEEETIRFANNPEDVETTFETYNRVFNLERAFNLQPDSTPAPTAGPRPASTRAPTAGPTPTPTRAPTAGPTPAPARSPTATPTPAPARAAEAGPTPAPARTPTARPTPVPPRASTAGPVPTPAPTPTPEPPPVGIRVPVPPPNPFVYTHRADSFYDTTQSLYNGLSFDASVNGYRPPVPCTTWVNQYSSDFSNQQGFSCYSPNTSSFRVNNQSMAVPDNFLSNYFITEFNRNFNSPDIAPVPSSNPVLFSDYQWRFPSNYQLSTFDYACVRALQREIDSIYPSGRRAWDWVKGQVGSEANYMTYDDFCNDVKRKGLMPSFNRSFASMRDLRDFLWEVGGIDLGDIGGIENSTGLITNLLQQPEAFTAQDYVFVFPHEMTPSLMAQFNQMKQEMAQAFAVDKALPGVSIHFNKDHSQHLVMHPSFQHGLCGFIVAYLDFWMKGYMNGSFYDLDFLRKWNGSMDETYLAQHAIKLEDYCRDHGFEYLSFNRLLANAGVDDKEVNCKYNQRYMTSFRIIAKQADIQFEKNIIFANPEFDIEYTIKPMADYQAELDDYIRVNGQYPEDYTKYKNCCEVFALEIKNKMPKLPLFQEYFKLLGMMNALGYLYHTLDKMGKMPVFDQPLQPFNDSIPVKLPPYPYNYYDKYPVTITFGDWLKTVALNPTQSRTLNAMLYRQMTVTQQKSPTVQETIILNQSIKDTIATKLPQNIAESGSFASFNKYTDELNRIWLENLATATNSMEQSFNELLTYISTSLGEPLLDNVTFPVKSRAIKVALNNHINSINQWLVLKPQIALGDVAFPVIPHMEFKAIEALTNRLIENCTDDYTRSVFQAEWKPLQANNGSKPLADHSEGLAKLVEICIETLENIKKSHFKSLELLKQKQPSPNNLLDFIAANFDVNQLSYQLVYLHSYYAFASKEPDRNLHRIYGGCDINFDALEAKPAPEPHLIARVKQSIAGKLHQVANFVHNNQSFSTASIAVKHTAQTVKHALIDAQQNVFSFLDSMNTSGNLPEELTSQDAEIALHPTGINLATYAVQLFPDDLLEKFIKRAPHSLQCADRRGNLPIHYACKRGNIKRVMDLLSRFPEQLEAKTYNKKTLLWFAVDYGHATLLEQLLAKGANPNARLPDESAPLFAAIESNRPEIAEILVKHPTTNLNVQRFGNVTPLHTALNHGMKNLSLLMISRGACTTIALSKNSYTALHLAVRLKQPEVLKVIGQERANIHEPLDSGENVLHLAAQYQPSLVEMLIPTCPIDAETLSGKTALAIAVEFGNYKAAQVLAKHTVTAVSSHVDNKKPFLIEAYERGMPLVSDILFNRIQRSLPFFESVKQDYFVAIVKKGDIARFQRMIKEFPELLKQQYDGKNCAEIAAISGHFQLYYTIKQLAERKGLKSFLNSQSVPAIQQAAVKQGELEWLKNRDVLEPLRVKKPLKLEPTELMEAAVRGHLSLLRHGFKKGASLENNSDLLIAAIQHNQLDVVKFLMDYFPARPSAKFDYIVHHAVLISSPAILGYLLEQLPLNPIFSGNQTPFHAAIWQENPSMLSVLLERLPQKFWPPSIWKMKTAHSGIKTVLKTYQQQLPESEQARLPTIDLSPAYERFTTALNRKSTPLHLAAMIPHGVDVLTIIKKNKAWLNQQNLKGETALIIALQNHNFEAANRLITEGADCNILDMRHANALIWALTTKNKMIASRILPLTENYWQGDLKQMNSLHYAAQFGHLDIVRRLCNEKPTASILTEGGMNALHIAASNNQLEIVQYLLKKRYPVNAPVSPDVESSTKYLEGATALHLALEKGFLKIVYALQISGADPLIRCKKGYSAAEYAIKSKNPDIIRYIEAAPFYRHSPSLLWAAAESDNFTILCECLLNEMPLNILNPQGYSALHLAIAAHAHSTAEHLLKQPNCSLELKSMDGYAPIHLAIHRQNGRLLEALLRNNAHVNSLNKDKKTALMLASEMGYELGVTILLAFHADSTLLDNNFKTALDLAKEKKHLTIVKRIEQHINVRDNKEVSYSRVQLLADETIQFPITPENIPHEPAAAAPVFVPKTKPTTAIVVREPQTLISVKEIKRIGLAWVAKNYPQALPACTRFVEALMQNTCFDTNQKMQLGQLVLIILAKIPQNQLMNQLERLDQLIPASEALYQKYNRYYFSMVCGLPMESNYRSFDEVLVQMIALSQIHLGNNRARYKLEIPLKAIKDSVKLSVLPPFSSFRAKFSTITTNHDVRYPLSEEELTVLGGYYDEILKYRQDLFQQNLTPLLARAKKPCEGIDTFCLAVIFEAYRSCFFYVNETQIITILALLNTPKDCAGRVGQVKTGQGKSTLIAAYSAYKALKGECVDIAVSADYLALRDAKELEAFYRLLQLSCAAIIQGRINNFSAPINFMVHTTLEFSLLFRDIYGHEDRKGRPLHVLMVDELDFMAIDKAANSAMISHPNPKDQTWMIILVAQFIESTDTHRLGNCRAFILKHCATEQQRADINQLSDKKLRKLLSQGVDIYQNYKINEDYVVKETLEQYESLPSRKIILVDKVSGRLSEANCHLNGSRHQFLQYKHGLPLSRKQLNIGSISHSTLLKMYPTVAGLTGTCGENREELKHYNMLTFDVPPHQPNQFQALPTQIAQNEQEQWNLILDEIKAMQRAKRPVLVLFLTIEQTERFGAFLDSKNIKYQLNNDMQSMDEESIINKAGQEGVITIATNTSTRGTNIRIVLQALINGGLHVINAFYALSREEIQALGRAARQGQLGSGRLILRFDDERILRLILRYPALFKDYPSRRSSKDMDVVSFMTQLNMARQMSEEEDSKWRINSINQELCRTHYMKRYVNQLSVVKQEFAIEKIAKLLTYNPRQPVTPLINHLLVNVLKQGKLDWIANWKKTVQTLISLTEPLKPSPPTWVGLDNVKELLVGLFAGRNLPIGEEWRPLVDSLKELFINAMHYEWAKFYSKLSNMQMPDEMSEYYKKVTKMPNSLLENPTVAIPNFMLYCLRASSRLHHDYYLGEDDVKLVKLLADIHWDNTNFNYLIRLYNCDSKLTDDLFWLAVSNGHNELVLYFMQKNPEFLTKVNALGDSIVHAAARSDQVALLRAITRFNPDYTLVNNDNHTALQLAIVSGANRCANFIAANYDFNQHDSHRQTAIISAYHHDLPELAFQLFNATNPVDIDIAKRLLHKIIIRGDLHYFNYLTEKLPELLEEKFDNLSIAEFSAKHHQFLIYHALQKPRVVDSELSDAERHEHNLAVISTGHISALRPTYKSLVLKDRLLKELYARAGEVNAIAALPLLNPSICFKNEFQIHSLKHAIVNGHYSFVNGMLQTYAMKKDYYGIVPLMPWAVQSSQKDIVKLLLHLGAPNWIISGKHMHAFEVAVVQDNLSMLKFLFKHVPRHQWPSVMWHLTADEITPRAQALVNHLIPDFTVSKSSESVIDVMKRSLTQCLRYIEDNNYDGLIRYFDRDLSSAPCARWAVRDNRNVGQFFGALLFKAIEHNKLEQQEKLVGVKKCLELIIEHSHGMLFNEVPEYNFMLKLCRDYSDEDICVALTLISALKTYSWYNFEKLMVNPLHKINCMELLIKSEKFAALKLLNEFFMSITNDFTRYTTPLIEAMKARNPQLIRAYLTPELVNTATHLLETPLMFAAFKGDVDTVNQLLQLNADVNCKNYRHLQPLHCAIKGGHQSIVQTLLPLTNHLWEPTLLNGNTALHLAAIAGMLPTVSRLCSEKNACNLVNKTGHTALHLAVINGHFGMVRYLIQQGFSIHQVEMPVKSKDRLKSLHRNPLQLAMLNPNLALIKFLTEEGASWDYEDTSGRNAFGWAALSKNDALQHYIESLPRYANNLKQIYLAAASTSIDLTEKCLAQGVPVNTFDKNKTTALHFACSNAPSIAQLLLDNELIELNCQDDNGATPLHIAVIKKNYILVTLLIQKGARTELYTSIEQTPLLIACEKGYTEIAQYLVGAEANIGAVDARGQNCIEVAKQNNHPLLAEWLTAQSDAKNNYVDNKYTVPPVIKPLTHLNKEQFAITSLPTTLPVANKVPQVSNTLHYWIQKSIKELSNNKMMRAQIAVDHPYLVENTILTLSEKIALLNKCVAVMKLTPKTPESFDNFGYFKTIVDLASERRLKGGVSGFIQFLQLDSDYRFNMKIWCHDSQLDIHSVIRKQSLAERNSRGPSNLEQLFSREEITAFLKTGLKEGMTTPNYNERYDFCKQSRTAFFPDIFKDVLFAYRDQGIAKLSYLQMLAAYTLLSTPETQRGVVRQLPNSRERTALVVIMAAYYAKKGQLVHVILCSRDSCKQGIHTYSNYLNKLHIAATSVNDKHYSSVNYQGKVVFGTLADFKYQRLTALQKGKNWHRSAIVLFDDISVFDGLEGPLQKPDKNRNALFFKTIHAKKDIGLTLDNNLLSTIDYLALYDSIIGVTSPLMPAEIAQLQELGLSLGHQQNNLILPESSLPAPLIVTDEAALFAVLEEEIKAIDPNNRKPLLIQFATIDAVKRFYKTLRYPITSKVNIVVHDDTLLADFHCMPGHVILTSGRKTRYYVDEKNRHSPADFTIIETGLPSYQPEDCRQYGQGFAANSSELTTVPNLPINIDLANLSKLEARIPRKIEYPAQLKIVVSLNDLTSLQINDQQISDKLSLEIIRIRESNSYPIQSEECVPLFKDLLAALKQDVINQRFVVTEQSAVISKKFNAYVSQLSKVVDWFNEPLAWQKLQAIIQKSLTNNQSPVCNTIDFSPFDSLTLSIHDVLNSGKRESSYWLPLFDQFKASYIASMQKRWSDYYHNAIDDSLLFEEQIRDIEPCFHRVVYTAIYGSIPVKEPKKDAFANLLRNYSLLRQSNNSDHLALVNKVKAICQNKFTSLVEDIENKRYALALRKVSNSCHVELVTLLLSYKDSLKINIQEPSASTKQTAIDFARSSTGNQDKKNQVICLLEHSLHEELVIEARNECKDNKNYITFIEALEQKHYGLALRKASAICHLKLVKLVISYKDLLKFNINEPSPTSGVTALDLAKAAKVKNIDIKTAVLDLLEKNMDNQNVTHTTPPVL